MDDHSILTGCAERGHKLIVGLGELLVFNRPAVIVQQRKQNFEPDHWQP
jgi:hypothetical protein